MVVAMMCGLLAGDVSGGCVVGCVRLVVSGCWCLVVGVRWLVFGGWCSVVGVRWLVVGGWCSLVVSVGCVHWSCSSVVFVGRVRRSCSGLLCPSVVSIGNVRLVRCVETMCTPSLRSGSDNKCCVVRRMFICVLMMSQSTETKPRSGNSIPSTHTCTPSCTI